MTVVQFTDYGLVAAAVIVGFLVGWRQGLRRALWVTAAIIVAWVLIAWFEPQVVALVNRLYRLTVFALTGGILAENPGEAYAKVANLTLISSPASLWIFRLTLFGLILWFGWWLGRRRPAEVGRFTTVVRRPHELFRHIMGGVAGAINAYLLLYFLIPRFMPGVQTVMVVPTFATTLLQQQWLPIMVVVLIGVFIVAGWAMARS